VRELAFVLRFTGQAGPVPGSTTLRRAQTSSPSQAWRTVLDSEGIESGVEPVPGDSAVLESRIERFADGSFVEDGTITYGRAGRITFETVGRGTVGVSPVPSQHCGAVIWTVTGGDGRFTGCRGLIASNFAVTADGWVVDDHVARLYLPT
jgi:hypothetical protein